MIKEIKIVAILGTQNPSKNKQGRQIEKANTLPGICSAGL